MQEAALPPIPDAQPITTPNPELKGVVGLQNMGATCYANSTIQLLRAVPELNAYILREDLSEACPDKDCIETKILLGYQDLIQSMWSAHRPAYVRPMGFLTVIREAVKGTVYENFGRPMQNDSHEYLVYLLDKFHEALNERRTGTPKPAFIEPPPEADMVTQAAIGWRNFTNHHTSPIVDLFFLMMRQTVECEECHNKTYSWQTLNVLKIPCEGATLHDWIKAECAPSTIDEYECLPCRKAHDKRQKANKYMHLWSLPPSLFMGVRRFTPDGRKVNTPLPYGGEPLSFEQHFAPESNHESKGWRYECRAISDHHGGTGGGHYSAQTAHPVTNQWWVIDDSMSQKLDSPRFGTPNYLLYFRKITRTEA
jgi:ubiquitin C-terminal hydrolase